MESKSSCFTTEDFAIVTLNVVGCHPLVHPSERNGQLDLCSFVLITVEINGNMIPVGLLGSIGMKCHMPLMMVV
jgi:hypothetical protein